MHQDYTGISPRDCPKCYIVVPSFHFAILTGSRALPAGLLLPLGPLPGRHGTTISIPVMTIMAIRLFAEPSQSQFKAWSEVDSDAAE
jgi:hypothetical protein